MVAAGTRFRYAAPAALVFGLAGSLLAPAPPPARAAERPEGCIQVARIVSIQGSLQIQRSGQSAWSVVRKLDTVLCQGDLLHAGPRSRAALLIGPETLVRLDQSTTLSVRQSPDETIVEFAKDPGLFQTVGTAPNPCGAGYFITRFPRKFRVIAPFIDATVEGTEFLVALRCESSMVAVFEGKVLAQEVQNASSRAFSLQEGDSLEAGGPQPAAVKLLVKPVDAVQWALYYPPITDAAGEVADQRCDQTDNSARAVCVLQRAEQRLRAGRVEEAEGDIQNLLSLGAGGGDAHALLAIIAVVKNEKATALQLAERATQQAPGSPRTWLALSYAQQASFALDQALAAARKAAALAPGGSLAQARVAELLMSTGEIRAAEQAAQSAVKANPNDARTHMVLGFVHLAQVDTKKAREDFLTAIEIDSTEPLARLGLGLAIIREGRLVEGREQIEIAVILDPSNSSLRSYLGKAYYEENTEARNQLAAAQYDKAKQLDPNDPTPWFYDAILKQTQNRPVDAVAQLQKSIELNDERAVYRSKLLLDTDRASRDATLANTFDTLGLKPSAVSLAAGSLQSDPSNYSAHQFLSAVYAQRARHELARTSELLQAQLYQPLAIAPTAPGIAFTDLRILPAPMFEAAYNEYPRLFQQPGPRFSAGGLVGTQGTWAGELAAGVYTDRLAFALGGVASHTDGFRPNNDLSSDIYDVFGQWLLAPELSVQAEYRHRSSDFGDVQMRFDPASFSPDNRFQIDEGIGRLGLRLAPRPDLVLLGSFFSLKREDDQSIFIPSALNIDVDATLDGQVGELLGVYSTNKFSVLVGGSLGSTQNEITENYDFSPSLPFPCLPPFLPCSATFTDDSRFQDAYVYGYLNPLPSLMLTLGLSYVSIEDDDDADDLWNPKLGVVWLPTPAVTLRAAAFRNFRRPLIGDQTIEPTQVAGFNRLYDEANSTVSWNYGLAADLRLPHRVTASIEGVLRDISFDSGLVGVPMAAAPEQEQRETTAGLTLSWIASQRVVANAGFLYDKFEWIDPSVPTTDPIDLVTYTAPVRVTYYALEMLALQLTATYVHQEVERLPISPWASGDESFVTVDLSASLRLPQRRGFVSLELKNLFDREFQYQDDNFRSPETRLSPYLPDFAAVLRVSLFF